jgi:hypothetical protein
MSDVNPSAEAGYCRAIEVAGVGIRVRRQTGEEPNSVYFEAEVRAIVRDYTPDAATAEQEGYNANLLSVTLGKRQVIIMRRDLEEKRFALPIVKADQILIDGDPTVLTIDAVDPYKRAAAGVIEIIASGSS